MSTSRRMLLMFLFVLSLAFFEVYVLGLKWENFVIPNLIIGWLLGLWIVGED